MKVQLVDVDPLVPGEGGVPAPCLEAEPGLVLVLSWLHVLPSLQGPLVQSTGHHVPALVQGRLLVLVLDGHQGPGVHQVLGDVCVAPEAGVVERSVAVLVDEVDVGLLSEQLIEIMTLGLSSVEVDGRTYSLDDVSVAMSGCQVEGSVVPHVGGVDPRPAGDQHLHDLDVTALGGPVQRGELMVITENIDTSDGQTERLLIESLTPELIIKWDVT